MNKVDRAPRRHLIHVVKIKTSNGSEFAGRLVDISESGIKMITKEKVFIGDTYRLEISIPETIDNSKEIICRGTVVWYRHHLNPERYSAGFEMEGVDKENQSLLNKLIDSFMN